MNVKRVVGRSLTNKMKKPEGSTEYILIVKCVKCHNNSQYRNEKDKIRTRCTHCNYLFISEATRSIRIKTYQRIAELKQKKKTKEDD